MISLTGIRTLDLAAAIVPIDLGEIDGTPLSFTDASALPDGTMVFTAVAEDADDPYDDGCCAAMTLRDRSARNE